MSAVRSADSKVASMVVMSVLMLVEHWVAPKVDLLVAMLADNWAEH